MSEYYLHFAHLESIRVIKGQTYPKGHVLGTLGDSGSPGQSHLHFEVQKEYRGNQYTSGMSKSQVEGLYYNPYDYLNKRYTLSMGEMLPGSRVTGWDWLQVNSSGQIHPGIDLNVGSGYDDYGMEIKLPEEAECVQTLFNVSGWGNHVFFKIINPKDMEKLDNYIAQTDRRLDLLENVEGDTKLVKRVQALKENKAGKKKQKKQKNKIKKWVSNHFQSK